MKISFIEKAYLLFQLQDHIQNEMNHYSFNEPIRNEKIISSHHSPNASLQNIYSLHYD